jgi:CHAT domain-containing protein/predicted negative regulator of RcsB-dependent stress response
MRPRKPTNFNLIRIPAFLLCLLVSAATTSRANCKDSLKVTFGLAFDSSIWRESITSQTRQGILIEKEIQGGGSDTCGLDLLSGQYAHLSINKEDLNTLVTVYGPGDLKIAEFISKRYGPLQFSFIANKAGLHRLEIRSLEKSNQKRSYRLELNAIRHATKRDEEAQLAVMACAEAEKLRATWKKDSLLEAIKRYSEASAIWRAAGRSGEAVDAQLNIAEVYYILSRYESALKSYEEALKTSVFINDRRREMLARNGLAYVHLSLSNNQLSFEKSNEVLAYYASLKPSRQDKEDGYVRAQALNTIGEIYYLKPDIQLALEYFNQALTLSSAIGNRAGQALAHLNLGYTHIDSGNLKESLKHFRQALSLWDEADDARGKALSNTAIGGIYSFTGEKQMALDSHEKALHLLSAIGDHQGEAAALNGIGKVYEDLGDFPKAFETYERALRLYQEIHNQEFEALTKYYLGRVCRTRGDNGQALIFYNESLELSRKVPNLRIQAYSLRDIASINSSSGEPRKALDLYNQTLGLYKKIEDRRGQASTYNNIAQVYYSLADTKEAINNYKKALDLSRAAEDRSAETFILFNLAHAHRSQGYTNEALSHINDAIENIESIRGHIISQDLRASYLASANKHYNLYIDLLYDAYKQQPNSGFEIAAFEASERYRARSLIEMLNESKLDIRRGVDLALLERERSLQQLLNAKAESQMRLLNSLHTEDQALKVKAEIDAIISDYRKVESEIRAVSPHYAALTQPRPLKLKEIQTDLLDSNTLLLEYFLGDDRSFLWAVSQTSITPYVLPGRAEIEDTARTVYKSLTAHNEVVKGEDAPQRKQRLRQAAAQYSRAIVNLSKLLLGQVQTQLEDKRLLIVADGALQYVPFSALLVQGERGAATPLIANHELISLPSASTLAILKREFSGRKPSPKLLAVLADPVFDKDDTRVKKPGNAYASGKHPPSQNSDIQKSVFRKASEDVLGRQSEGGWPRLLFSRMEAEEIVKASKGGRIKKALGFGANKTLATSPELSSFRIVHFATHGIIDSLYPELSGIVLSLVTENGSSQDGFLRLHEIFNLKLRADLAVLSACQTALGKEIRGEGLVGLTRGFMYAGAARVVASLWNVRDEATAELMKRFYTAMFRDGKTASAALQAAQSSMWRDSSWQSPYYWAAFVIQGDWR